MSYRIKLLSLLMVKSLSGEFDYWIAVLPGLLIMKFLEHDIHPMQTPKTYLNGKVNLRKPTYIHKSASYRENKNEM